MAVRFQRRKKYTRPGYRSCSRMVIGDAKKALLIARGVKRLLNIEIKNFDVQQNAVSIPDTPIIIQLSNIPQGDTTSSRDGAQCKMVGIDMNYTVNMHASATITQVRILLVIDKQTNQAIYLNTDLLDDVSIRDNIVSPRNLDNLHRFTVLYDRVHIFQVGGTQSVHVHKYFKKDLLLRYDASTPSIADLTQSSVSFMQMGSEATNSPSIVSHHRLRFVDN